MHYLELAVSLPRISSNHHGGVIFILSWFYRCQCQHTYWHQQLLMVIWRLWETLNNNNNNWRLRETPPWRCSIYRLLYTMNCNNSNSRNSTTWREEQPIKEQPINVWYITLETINVNRAPTNRKRSFMSEEKQNIMNFVVKISCIWFEKKQTFKPIEF